MTAMSPPSRIGGGRQRRGLRTLTILTVVLLVAACTRRETGSPPTDARRGQPGLETDTAAVDERPPPESLAEDQTLNVFSFFRPPSFDPGQQASGTIGGNGLGRQYTEPLLKAEAGVLDPRQLDVVGAAAEGYEVSGDGRVYTFTLREEARFNDGEPVEAEDYVFAWRRLIDPRLGAPSAAPSPAWWPVAKKRPPWAPTSVIPPSTPLSTHWAFERSTPPPSR